MYTYLSIYIYIEFCELSSERLRADEVSGGAAGVSSPSVAICLYT